MEAISPSRWLPGFGPPLRFQSCTGFGDEVPLLDVRDSSSNKWQIPGYAMQRTSLDAVSELIPVQAS
jgi:hypothetical protein